MSDLFEDCSPAGAGNKTDEQASESQSLREPEPAARILGRWRVTSLLIGVTALAYLLSVVLGDGLLNISFPTLYSLGGNVAAFSLTGDGWRLLTNIFLHAGPLHLLLNLYMLFLVGKLSECWFGQLGTLAIYLLGGLWASYASACWLGWKTISDANADLTVSVGASGAIMALCGAVVVMAWLHDDTPPPLAKEGVTLSGTGNALVQTVAINVVMGFAIKGVDQAAHLGGLAAGTVLGLAVGAVTDTARSGWVPHRRIVFTALVTGAVLYGCLRLAPWPVLREWRVVWDKEAVEEEAAERRAAEAPRVEREARRAEAEAAKARTKAADALRATLPAPVSEPESAGQSIPLEDAAAVARIEAEFAALPPPRGMSDAIDEILPRQGPVDGLVLIRTSASGLALARPRAQEASPQVIEAWTLCDAEYMGQVMEPGAAWHDGAGRQLVAALGHQPVVSVTDLATGVEIGMYSMPGYPKRAQFSADGKRLLIESRDSGDHRYLNVVDIARRMSDANARQSVPNALICGWAKGDKLSQAL
ncbi:rhomboid family intramembrane serine protease [Ralstonia solanacearum]|uniref:rhomboid family intramembrane serine protease n=1 Tax=Ralstonia solanacearum TaxID=305 RepID=UPI0009C03E57|nr:rhomboid family intramembrane serine protease [Ralstonia solanacearum]